MIHETGRYFLHKKSKEVYRYLLTTNENAKENSSFTLTAVYQCKDGIIWSRPMDEFNSKFIKIPFTYEKD